MFRRGSGDGIKGVLYRSRRIRVSRSALDGGDELFMGNAGDRVVCKDKMRRARA